MTEPPSVTVSLCDLGQLTDPLWASVLSPGERCLHCPRGPHQDGRSEKNGVLPRGPHFSAAHHLPETPNPTRSSSHSMDGFFAPSLSGRVTPPVHRADFHLQWGKEERAESSCLTPASCRKGGATSPPAEDLPEAPNPPTGLGGGRGAGALGTLAGERGTLAWRQSLGPGGHTGAGGAWGGRGPRRRQRACVYAWVASLGSGVS